MPDSQHRIQETSYERQALWNAVSFGLPTKADALLLVSPLPLCDAKVAIQFQLNHLPGLAIKRRLILECALRVVSQLPGGFEGHPQETRENNNNNNNDNSKSGNQKIPSIELLTWMASGKSQLAKKSPRRANCFSFNRFKKRQFWAIC